MSDLSNLLETLEAAAAIVRRMMNGGDVANRQVSSSGVREQVYEVIARRSRGGEGTTCDDVERITGLTHQTASARVNELAADGEITPNGQRKTRSGKPAAAYWLPESIATEPEEDITGLSQPIDEGRRRMAVTLLGSLVRADNPSVGRMGQSIADDTGLRTHAVLTNLHYLAPRLPFLQETKIGGAYRYSLRNIAAAKRWIEENDAPDLPFGRDRGVAPMPLYVTGRRVIQMLEADGSALASDIYKRLSINVTGARAVMAKLHGAGIIRAERSPSGKTSPRIEIADSEKARAWMVEADAFIANATA